MKIITSLARPGDAPINGRSTTIQPSLFTLCVPPSISRLDLPRSLSLSFSFPLPLLVSYLPRYRPLSLTSSRSDDEFIGGSRAEWSCNARLALFEGQTWKMKRSSVLATERLLAHVSAPIVAFLLVPSSSRCPLLATCLAWNLLEREREEEVIPLIDRGDEKIMISYSSSSFRFNHNCNSRVKMEVSLFVFLFSFCFFYRDY